MEHRIDPTPVAPSAPTFSARVEEYSDLDTCCVRVRGLIRDGGGDLLGATIDEAVPEGRVLVDLHDATVQDVTTVADLVDHLAAHHPRGELAVTCPRSWRRSGLRRAGIEEVAPVFASRGDALQALVMEARGLGAGWAPMPPVPPFSPRTSRHLRALDGRDPAPARSQPLRPARRSSRTGWS